MRERRGEEKGGELGNTCYISLTLQSFSLSRKEISTPACSSQGLPGPGIRIRASLACPDVGWREFFWA